MFWKKAKTKDGKFYPKSVLQQTAPVSTKEVAERLAAISTVSYADVLAVLAEMPGVLADYMAQGRSVRLDNLGIFRYVAYATQQTVDTADEVSAKLFKGVRVRYVPETTRSGADGTATRAIVSDNIQWVEVSATAPDDDDAATDSDDNTSSGGTDDDESLYG